MFSGTTFPRPFSSPHIYHPVASSNFIRNKIKVVFFIYLFWQITHVFLDGHSNPKVKIVGLSLSPLLENIKVPDPEGEMHYFSLPS